MERAAWTVTAAPPDPGWLEIPDPAGLDAPAWVEARAAELRADWGERWRQEHDVLVPAALEHALASRLPDDALCFQYWPVRELRAVLVHVAFGAADAPIDWAVVPGSIARIELPGVGPGVRRLFGEQLSVPEVDEPVDLVGVDLVCEGGDALLHVRLEATIPTLAADVAAPFQAFAQSLAVEGPSGPWRSAEPSAAALGDSWAAGDGDSSPWHPQDSSPSVVSDGSERA